MPFDVLLGHENIKKIFKNILKNEKIANSILLIGENGVGKTTYAISLIKSMFCKNCIDDFCDVCDQCLKISKFAHADFKYIFPIPTGLKEEEIADLLNKKSENNLFQIRFDKNSSISIEVIRELKNWSYKSSFEAKYKVAFIEDIDKMTLQAANAFLKILEEPPQNVYFILTTDDENKIIETILSRCLKIYFQPFSNNEIKNFLIDKFSLNDEKINNIVSLSNGSLTKAIDLVNFYENEEKKLLDEFIDILISKDLLKVIELAENLNQSKERNKINIFFEEIYFFMRDLFIIYLKSISNIYYIDKVEILNQIARNINIAEDSFKEIFYEIEKAKEYVNQNVNIEGIIISLIGKILKILERN